MQSIKARVYRGQEDNMISLRGPKLKILAAVLAVIALAAGIYLTFFR